MIERVSEFLTKAIDIIKKPEMRILPGQLAFFFVISLIPLIALMGALSSTFSISVGTIKNGLLAAFPTSSSEMLTNLINGQGLNFNMGIFLISAFILASNGPHSMIITSNEIYHIKSSNVISRRLKAIVMTLVLVCLLFFLLLVPVFGDTIFYSLREVATNTYTIDVLYRIYQLLKYPISIVLVYLNIKLLYVMAPDKKVRSSTIRKGALFTTITWILSTEIYSFYVETFSKYDLFYGSISNLLILLLWVYMLSYIFVLGMALNASDAKESDIEKTGYILKR